MLKIVQVTGLIVTGVLLGGHIWFILVMAEMELTLSLKTLRLTKI